jgi:hypothetical protein
VNETAKALFAVRPRHKGVIRWKVNEMAKSDLNTSKE